MAVQNAQVARACSDILSACCNVLQGFVRHTAVGLYSFRQVWQCAPAQRDIMKQLRLDPRLSYEQSRCQLPLASNELQLAMQSSVTALVNSFQVCSWAGPVIRKLHVLNPVHQHLYYLTRIASLHLHVSCMPQQKKNL